MIGLRPASYVLRPAFPWVGLGLALLLGVAAAPAHAQRAQSRTALERQVQQQLWRVTRTRVGLSDAQMRQLVPVNQKFEVRRRAILREERETRQALRKAVIDTTSADDARVSAHIDRLLQLERQRIDLLQEEQGELAKIMTPRQRARYMALQEQFRRRVEQRLRARAGGDDSVAAGRRPRPGASKRP